MRVRGIAQGGNETTPSRPNKYWKTGTNLYIIAWDIEQAKRISADIQRILDGSIIANDELPPSAS